MQQASGSKNLCKASGKLLQSSGSGSHVFNDWGRHPLLFGDDYFKQGTHPREEGCHTTGTLNGR